MVHLFVLVNLITQGHRVGQGNLWVLLDLTSQGGQEDLVHPSVHNQVDPRLPSNLSDHCNLCTIIKISERQNYI